MERIRHFDYFDYFLVSYVIYVWFGLQVNSMLMEVAIQRAQEWEDHHYLSIPAQRGPVGVPMVEEEVVVIMGYIPHGGTGLFIHPGQWVVVEVHPQEQLELEEVSRKIYIDWE